MGRKSKNYSAREKEQDRKFECIIYPDSTEYDAQILLNRLSSFWDDFYYILHDCDFYTDVEIDTWKIDHPGEPCPYEVGEIKKPHYHVIGYLNNPTILGTAAVKFGVPSNQVQCVRNLKKSIQYLIHLNNPEKFQYSSDAIVSNNRQKVESVLKQGECSVDKAKRIYEYIESTPNPTIAFTTRFCLENDLWDEFRRAQHLFTALINEKRYMKNGL